MAGNKIVLMVAAVVIGAGTVGYAAARDFQLQDVPRIVSLSEARISPNGHEIAVVVSRPDTKTDKPDQQIDLLDVASGVLRPLTRHRKDVHAPRWSPHGHRLAFIARPSTAGAAGKAGTPQAITATASSMMPAAA